MRVYYSLAACLLPAHMFREMRPPINIFSEEKIYYEGDSERERVRERARRVGEKESHMRVSFSL